MPKSLLKKKSVSRKTLKLKSNNKSKFQNKYNSKSKSKSNSKSKSKKNKKKHSRNHKGGAACEYLKVEEMKFDDLKIPEQYSLLDSNCQQSGVPSATSHPNLST